MQIIDQVLNNLSSWGSHPVLIEPRRDASFLAVAADDLQCRIGDLSGKLQAWGIAFRSPVFLFLENSVDFVAVFLALLRLGAVPVPLKIEYRKMELEEIVRTANPGAVICEGYHLPVVEEYCGRSTLITRNEAGFTLRKREDADPPGDIDGEIVSINYTYRGYGYPLGALLPEGQYLHGARVVQDELAGSPGDVMLILLPLSHIFPMICGLFLCLLYRLTALIARTMHPRLIFGYIHRYKVDYVIAVPEIYELLWKSRGMAENLSSLKLLFSGGSRLSDRLYHGIRRDFGVFLAHGYGLTEFTPVSRNSANHNRAGTVGPVCNGVKVKIDRPSADGSGEILIKTAAMARGYLHRAVETAAAFSEGWFLTGDIGRFDNGHLVFLRERKNTRKVNGNMVDLCEVERAFLSVPGVHEARVTHDGGALTVFVESSSNGCVTDAIAIKKDLIRKIARYKIPKYIVTSK
jgi:long-chain acyl-CoA synthetase